MEGEHANVSANIHDHIVLPDGEPRIWLVDFRSEDLDEHGEQTPSSWM
jgi:hypothetical protein